MRRSRGILGVPLLLVAGLAAALLYAFDRPEGLPAVAAAAPTGGLEEALPAAPSDEELELEQLVAPIQLTRLEVPTEDRIAAALAELTPMLDAPALMRTRWDLTARALARYVGPKAGTELLEFIAAPRTSPPDRIAAAELLRRISPAAVVPPQALADLRQAAFGGLPDGAQASAARRVLAGLGDWSDRLRLVADLEGAPTEETALAASWSLRASRSHDVLPDLRRLIHAGADSTTAELAMLSAESILRSTGPVIEDVRGSLTDSIVVAVGFRPELGDRAAGLLGALGGHKARRALVNLVHTEAAGPATQALAESYAGRQMLTGLLKNPTVAESGRLAVATALARGADSDELTRQAALEELHGLARGGQRADLRRRAVLALVEYGPDAAASIEAALLEDPDASVRATAVVATRRLDDPSTVQAALSACLVGDESAGVRELAGQVLSETGVSTQE